MLLTIFYLALVMYGFEGFEKIDSVLSGPFEDPVSDGWGLVDINRLIKISLRKFFRSQEVWI